MLAFPNRILFVGFGAVARCTLPILLKTSGVDPKHITIMDFEPNGLALKPWIEQGMTFVQDRVTPENLGALLGQHVSAGDLIIDLAWNIDCSEIVQWCHDRGVLYVNTSVELWDPYGGRTTSILPSEHSTAAHESTTDDRGVERARSNSGARTRSEPGPDQPFHQACSFRHRPAGPVRQKFSGAQAEKIAHHAKAQELNHLAYQLGVRVIHCSERDTQITDQPKQVNEFVNTWSVEGFREEGTTTAEMGWGTHEKQLPPLPSSIQTAPKARYAWRAWA